MASGESTSLNIEKTSNNLDSLQKNSEQPTKKKINLNQHQRKKRRQAKMRREANEPPPSIDPQVALPSKKKRKRNGPNLNQQQRIKKWKDKMSINANGLQPQVLEQQQQQSTIVTSTSIPSLLRFGTEDQEAQIEVATQCLEGAFGVSDKNYAFQPSKPLIDIFKAAEGLPDGDDEFPTPTEAEIAQANKLKEEGNELVKQSKFDEAILKYNDAIKLNRDPVYFCNRAAAYYDLAIQDCRTALALDPNYAKAYGRMGVALSCQNRYDQAVEAYKKALEIDPSSESYKNNLSIAKEKLTKARETFANNPQDPLGGLGGFGALFNNPDLARSIGAMMQEPGVRNMMQNVMQNMFGGGAAGVGDGNQPGGGGGNPMADMLRAGEAMASVINQANPQLVEMLRRQFGGGGDGNNENNGGGGNNNSNGGGQPSP